MPTLDAKAARGGVPSLGARGGRQPSCNSAVGRRLATGPLDTSRPTSPGGVSWELRSHPTGPWQGWVGADRQHKTQAAAVASLGLAKGQRGLGAATDDVRPRGVGGGYAVRRSGALRPHHYSPGGPVGQEEFTCVASLVPR